MSRAAFRDDPRWQAAQARYLAEDADGETDVDVLMRRINAAYEMQVIQQEVGR